MFVLTDKGALAQFKKDKIVLRDALDNLLPLARTIAFSDDLAQCNLFPCFLINEEKVSKAKELDPDTTSLLIGDGDSLDTFKHSSEQLLKKLWVIEWTASQLAYGKGYQLPEILTWRKFNENEVEIRDCRCGAKEYEKFISKWMQEYPELTKAFQLHHELSRLCEVVRHEMAHAEARLLAAIRWIQVVSLNLNRDKSYKNGCEYVHYGIISDEVGWCITDTIKALSTALDAMSKYIFLLGRIDIKVFPRTTSCMAGHLANYKPKGKYVGNDLYVFVQQLVSEIQPLINLRHELTHNQALFPIRQAVYIGFRTPCVNNFGISYGEALWWDKDKDTYSRSCGRTGFLTEKNNAILETKKSFISAWRLIMACFDSAFYELFSRIESRGIDEISFLQIGDDYKEKYETGPLSRALTSYRGD